MDSISHSQSVPKTIFRTFINPLHVEFKSLRIARIATIATHRSDRRGTPAVTLEPKWDSEYYPSMDELRSRSSEILVQPSGHVSHPSLDEIQPH